MERAGNILVNWIGDMTLENILDVLAENDNLDKEELETKLGAELEWIFKTIGEVYQIIGHRISLFFRVEDLSERYKMVRAQFTKGWLDKGKLYLDEDGISRTISNISWFYVTDLEYYIMVLMDYNAVNKVVELTNKYKDSMYSKGFKIRLATWSIINGQDDCFKRVIDDIINHGFNYVNKKHDRNVFNNLVLIAFILAYSDSNANNIMESFFKTYMEGNSKEGERNFHAAYSLVLVSIHLGLLYRSMNLGTIDEICNIEDYERDLKILLSESNIFGRHEINSIESEKYLLKQYIKIANKIGDNYKDSMHKIIKERAQNFKNIRYLDIYWEFLKEKRETQILEGLYGYWMDDRGQVWNQDIGELMDISDNFINKAYEMNWVEKAEKAKASQKQKYIGYTGRKEYSLYTPLKWYRRLDGKINNLWKDIGVKFLNISKNVSNLGDNRAFVQINSAVSESAGKEGFKDLWCFANITNNWDDRWIRVLFDGIISSLQSHSFFEQELLKLWEISTKIFYVRDIVDIYDRSQTLRKVYISDIKEAIVLVADRLGYLEIRDKMKAIDEYAFSIKGYQEMSIIRL